ncbi:hypothetical protein [Streptomyces sp. NPDC001076]
MVAELDGVRDRARFSRDAQQGVPQPHDRALVRDEESAAATGADVEHPTVTQEPDGFTDGGARET